MTLARGQVADAGADPRLNMLQACRKALGRETHTLTDRPEILWQQLYNRLQWEEEPVPGLLEPELHRRSAPGAAPWLRTRTRLRESEALRLTLGDHADPSHGLGIPNIFWEAVCAISPDSQFVVTAKEYGTCKIWDAATGRERATLTGHTKTVNACAISPDCSFVVTASDDDTCRMWDAATGEDRMSLTGHTDAVHAVVFAPDGRLLVSVGEDSTVRLWGVLPP